MEEQDYQEQEIVLKLWHGTSKENAKMILESHRWLETIENEKPFFGNGVYFMKDNKNLACLWLRNKNFGSQCAILCFLKVKRKFVFDLAVDKCYKVYEKFARVTKNFRFSSSILNAIYESVERGILDIQPIKVVIGYYSLGLLNESSRTSDECINKAVKIEIQVVVKDQNLIEIKRVEEC